MAAIIAADFGPAPTVAVFVGLAVVGMAFIAGAAVSLDMGRSKRPLRVAEALSVLAGAALVGAAIYLAWDTAGTEMAVAGGFACLAAAVVMFVAGTMATSCQLSRLWACGVAGFMGVLLVASVAGAGVTFHRAYSLAGQRDVHREAICYEILDRTYQSAGGAETGSREEAAEAAAALMRDKASYRVRAALDDRGCPPHQFGPAAARWAASRDTVSPWLPALADEIGAEMVVPSAPSAAVTAGGRPPADWQAAITGQLGPLPAP